MHVLTNTKALTRMTATKDKIKKIVFPVFRRYEWNVRQALPKLRAGKSRQQNLGFFLTIAMPK